MNQFIHVAVHSGAADSAGGWPWLVCALLAAAAVLILFAVDDYQFEKSRRRRPGPKEVADAAEKARADHFTKILIANTRKENRR